jgi:hypothetical protein
MDFKELIEKAQEAGRQAADALTPIPMIVGEAKDIFSSEIDETKPTYFVADGVCGFAWVDILERKNSPFCKYLLAHQIASERSEGKGVYIWVSDYNQSMQKKEAHARAFAQVIKDAGFSCYSNSRMD